jgi:bifunctional DNA-binding transcriptional regulator/antitoxin component of YhaV-PrlF toxin-antitoxin module
MGITRVIRLRKKGQLTLPEDVRTALGLVDGAPLWLALDEGVITLSPYDPAGRDRGGRVAEPPARYSVHPAPDVDAGRAPASRPTLTLGQFLAFMETVPHLSPGEAEAFAKDLEDIRNEVNASVVRDPWAED